MDWSLHETFSLGDFNLQSGGVLSGAFLAYKTFGDVKNPAIIPTTCYAASISDYKGIVGPNSKSLNTNRYFIIIPALIGNGESVSPSNRPGLHGQFPVVTFYDNVRAQYQLVHDHLGIDHVKAVCGFSMGGGEAYQWAVQYPDFVDVSVPICTSARTSIHNNVFLEGVKAAIVAARGGVSAGIGKGQIYPTNEPWTDAQKDVAMKALGRVYAGWGFSQAWYREKYYQKYLGAADIDTFLQVFWEGWATKNDPEDMLLMLQTWQLADVSKTSPEFQGDLGTALKHIQCHMVVMPGKTDMYFPVEDSEYEVGLMEPGIGSLVVIPSIWGHWAGGMGDSPEDWAFVDSQMSQAFEDIKR